MARRTKKTNRSSLHLSKRSDELSFLYKSAKDGDIYSTVGTLEANQRDLISDYLGDYQEKFYSVYQLAYIPSIRDQNRKKEQEALKRIEELNKEVITQVLSVENGYKVMDLAERKYGAKVNWQEVPVPVITSLECMDFLAGKKYDFNAKQTYKGKTIDFTTYHTAGVSQYETETIEKFDKLRETIRQRDKLVQDFQKMRAEYSKPETTSERKNELLEQMKQADVAFKPIAKELPQMCDKVSDLMYHYFMHAGLLKHAADKKYLSDENLKKIQLDKLNESGSDMVERFEKMKKINQFFNPKNNQTNATKSSEQSLADAKVYGAGGISGMLASAENSNSVYANCQGNREISSKLIQYLGDRTSHGADSEADNLLARNIGAQSNG